MPGEGIRYRARVEAAAGGPYSVRLVITGNGWYETHDAGPFAGSRTIEWGGPGQALYTSGDAYPGKVALTLDVRAAEGDQPATLLGRPQGYFTIRCPGGLPSNLSEPLEVGLDPWDMAFSKDNRYLYVTSQNRRTVAVIDLDRWETVSVLPPDYERINDDISACQRACPPLDFDCYNGCVERFAILGRPAGLAPADLGSAGQRMLLADDQLERVYVIERDGSRHWLGEPILVPPPGEQPTSNLADVVGTPSNELFVADRRNNDIVRLNLAPPHNIRRLSLPGITNAPFMVLLDPLAPNQGVYVLGTGIRAFRVVHTPPPMRVAQTLNMNLFPPSITMSLNPDPARRWLYVLKSPAGAIDPVQPEVSSFVYYWNLDNPTPAGGSGPVLYEKTLAYIACVQKGELRGRFAYALDGYRGRLRLLNLESRILLRDCDVPVGSVGLGRIIEDPVRDRVYVTNGAAGTVRYLSGGL